MINTFEIQTVMGEARKKLPFLTEEEFKEFNSIGYSGKTIAGDNISRTEYLNSLGKGEFKVVQIRCDDGDFVEEFLIIQSI